MIRKIKIPEEPSFWKYLDLMKEKLPLDQQLNFDHYLYGSATLGSCLDAGPCVIYLLDYRTKQYRFISKNVENITGYAADAFYNDGVSFSLSLYHPTDLAIFINKIFKKKLNLLHNTPAVDHDKLRFSYNYRFRRRDGVYIHLVQQSFVIESDTFRNPLLHFGICSDISSYKSDDKIIFTISKRNENGEYEIVFSECYPSCEDKLLSKREIEVVKLIMEGMSSKVIADKLFLSLHTVKTHRKNIQKKTHAKNTPDLLRYVALHGFV